MSPLFVAGAHITDLQTETKLAAHTEDISADGCFIETIAPLAADTKIRVQIMRNGQHMVAHGLIRAHAGAAFVSNHCAQSHSDLRKLELSLFVPSNVTLPLMY